MSAFKPFLLSCLFLFALLSGLFFGWVRGVNYCCCSYSIFHSIPKLYLFLAFHVTERVAYFFLAACLQPEKVQKNPRYLRPTLNTLYQVTHTE